MMLKDLLKHSIGADDFPVVGDELELSQPSLGPCDHRCPVNPAAAGMKGVTSGHRRNHSCLAGPATYSALWHKYKACPGQPSSCITQA